MSAGCALVAIGVFGAGVRRRTIHFVGSANDHFAPHTTLLRQEVSQGANVKAVNRAGQTTVDEAQRLEGLGVKNNHKCVSC